MTGDRRRWLVLVSVAMSALIVTIDSSVLTAAIPRIMRDFDASLPSVQWVLAGYSLVGASLMLPATLAVISITFQGRERATAFAVWGAVFGFGVAIGPVLGGWLTSELSWRWAFGINLVVAPVSALGVLLFLFGDVQPTRRPRLDVADAALVAIGLFLLVFAISEGHRYGWWRPPEGPTIAGLSIIPYVFVLAVVLLTAFVFVELRKERAARDPLFEFGQLSHHGYGYGLLTTATLAMGRWARCSCSPTPCRTGAG